MADQVQIELEIVAKDALASVDKFTKETQKQLDSISMKSTFTAVKAGFDIVSTVVNSISNLFSHAVSEAANLDKAINSLNNAMRINGDYSEFASQRAIEYANNLAKVTVNSNDQILSALSLAKNYGLTNQEARKVVKVAADLAAITGDDLNSATQKLASTYNNFIDKNLKKMVPALQSITDAQARTGIAVELLGKKLSGSAANSLDTYAGKVSQAKKEVNDFYEKIGTVSIRVTAFLIRDTIALENNISSFLNLIKRDSTIGPTIFDVASKAIRKANQDTIENLKEQEANSEAVKQRAKEDSAAQAKARLDAFKSGFTEKRKQLEIDALDEVSKVNRKFENDEKDVRKAFSIGLIKTKKEEVDLIAGLEKNRAKEVIDTQKRLRSEINAVIRASLSEREQIQADYVESQKSVEEAITKNAIQSAEEKNKILLGIEKEHAKKVKDLIEKENAPFAAGGASKLIGSALEGTSITTENFVAAGAGFISTVTKGAEGARDAVAGAVGAVANYFIPGIGGVVSEITKAFSYGPESVKKFVKDFELAVPDMVQNILTSIPAFVQQIVEDAPLVIKKIVESVPLVINAFVDSIGTIVGSFIESVPQIIESLAQGLPKAFAGIASIWPKIAVSFLTALIKGLPGIFKIMISEFLKMPKIIIDSIIEGFKQAFSSIGDLFGGGGSGGGGALGGVGDFFGNIGSSIGGFLGLADGGRVPDSPQFEGDRFPARLNAGEQVLSKDLSSQLENFLGSGGRGQNMTVNLIIGNQQLARAMLNLNRKGFRTA
jgi:hypothetical protein